MKKVEKTQVRQLQRQFRQAAGRLRVTGYLCQGTVLARHLERTVGGRPKRFGPYYVWTRKVKARTVTTALSPAQYRALRQAIARHRQLDAQLQHLRELSTRLILLTNPSVRTRLRRNSSPLT